MLYERGSDYAVNLLDVPLVQRNKDCLLVRKVLIDRTDAHAGDFGNPVCGESPKSFALQHSPYSLEYGFDSLAGAPLRRPAAYGLPGSFCCQKTSNKCELFFKFWRYLV